MGSFWGQILSWWTNTEKLVCYYLYLAFAYIIYSFLFSMCYSDNYIKRNIVKYYYSTVRKVAGLILDGVIEIFYWFNPSGRNMALRSNRPLKEVCTRNISWGKGGRCVGLTPRLYEPIAWKSGGFHLLVFSGSVYPFTGMVLVALTL